MRRGRFGWGVGGLGEAWAECFFFTNGNALEITMTKKPFFSLNFLSFSFHIFFAEFFFESSYIYRSDKFIFLIGIVYRYT